MNSRSPSRAPRRFELELRQLQQVALSRGNCTTGGAVAKGPNAGQQQAALAGLGRR